MDIERLVATHPRLYHMAEAGAWPSILRNGLLSTTAVLDRFGIKGKDRLPFESEHRPARMLVPHWSHPDAVVLRDQKPMPPDALRRVLPPHVSPRQWYKLVNRRVFFWAAWPRLETLLHSRSYRTGYHDVMVLDTQSLVDAYEEHIHLTHMNTGTVMPWYTPRDPTAFKRIADYPVRASGSPVKPVVELTVEGKVLDVERFVLTVHRMHSSEDSETVWTQPG